MAFKIVDDPYGQLTFMRLYQGTLEKGGSYYNQRSDRKERFGRIVRMHADQREEIDRAVAGDIVAVMGVDCASGDTYAQQRRSCTLESIFVPEPVIKVAVAPRSRVDGDRLGRALNRFRKEDPTFHVLSDEETGETILAGMGELHLEVYVERIRREYRVDVEVGAPKVSYREAPACPAEFNFRHKKQTGGAGQMAHIIGRFEPLGEDADETFVFEEQVTGGRIPKEYIPSVEKGFRQVLAKGPLAGYPVIGLRAVLTDGSHHEVDSSDLAFQTCARNCFARTFPKTKPVLLEPIMHMDIECPVDFQGQVSGDVVARRGQIVSTDASGHIATIAAEVPLAEMFGYATHLRSLTQGQGTFTMQPHAYRKVPSAIQEVIIAQKREERNAELVATR
jgi:elongation factor G